VKKQIAIGDRARVNCCLLGSVTGRVARLIKTTDGRQLAVINVDHELTGIVVSEYVDNLRRPIGLPRFALILWAAAIFFLGYGLATYLLRGPQ